MAALPAMLAGPLVDLALGAVRQELLREAERYEHQYSARLLLTTSDLDRGGVILITRWIDAPATAKRDAPTAASAGCSVGADLKPELENQIVDATDDAGLPAAIDRLLASPPKGAGNKVAVAAVALRVTPERQFVYRLSGANLWVKAVGAKVVDFGWRNAPRIWQWPGALIFATDGQMGFATTMETKALVSSKIDAKGNVTAAKWVDITPESDVLESVKLDLDKLPLVTPLGSSVGSWVMVPTVGDKADRLGFTVMTFHFTERDSSNAKKYITQAADQLKNDGTLSDLAKKALGAK